MPADLSSPIERSRANVWHATPLDRRCEWLHRVRADALAGRARQQLGVRTLPGPTGEHNELRLRGRGVIAAISRVADAATQAQWQAALAAGNTLLLAMPSAAREQAEGVIVYWQRAGALPEGAVQVLDAPFEAAAAALADDDRISGLIVEPDFAAPLARRVALRRGPIVPVFCGDLSAALWRLAAEQTLTVNTAAAGGNAALLAGVS